MLAIATIGRLSPGHVAHIPSRPNGSLHNRIFRSVGTPCRPPQRTIFTLPSTYSIHLTWQCKALHRIAHFLCRDACSLTCTLSSLKTGFHAHFFSWYILACDRQTPACASNKSSFSFFIACRIWCAYRTPPFYKTRLHPFCWAAHACSATCVCKNSSWACVPVWACTRLPHKKVSKAC